MSVPYEETIQKIYIAYYQRPADPEGLLYWSDRLQKAGGDLSEIIDAFANSPESQSLYGNKSVEEILTEIYNAAFNRDPDPVGLAFYTEKIESGEYSLTDVLLRVLDGAINEDAEILQKKIQLAEEFIHRLDPDMDGENWTFDYRREEIAQKVREWFREAVKSPYDSIPDADSLWGRDRKTLFGG